MNRAEITVKPIASSITDGGDRIDTMEWTYPRAIHAEVLTHGMLRRNSASSRAIPAAALRGRVLDAPFVPEHWGQNQKGMQAAVEVTDIATAMDWWLRARASAATYHEEGERLGLHKQIVNRVIEPWTMITIIITATEWPNFFHLRKHKDAEPHFQKLATGAWETYHETMPVYRAPGEWHLPMADDEVTAHTVWNMTGGLAGGLDTTIDALKKISTGRCARVSYLTHRGVRDISDDIALHDKLIANGAEGGPMHMSPFEHPNMAVGGGERIGPFVGWKQYRKFFANEAGPAITSKCAKCGGWNGNHVKVCPAA